MGWNLSRLYSRSRTESPELGSPSVFIAEYILILFEVNLLSSTTSLSLIFRPKKLNSMVSVGIGSNESSTLQII